MAYARRVALLAILILMLNINLVLGRHRSQINHSGPEPNDETENNTVQIAVQTAGSRLPDCSHACGSCSPCRLVTVSFVCASLQEAETCPMAYKCMCNRKSYPIP